ncbi:tRNA 2-thiouridine(34) synthase MnmA [Candidatus Wolfebacteria bacterium]|nr:tRNA 2-thiouridine(34) synthase MnmA [Candidatus Wolfebacteria bacterium]
MKVFVGMSGGVDSSVTAAELHKKGHDVVGVFLKGWYPENIPCTWKEDRQDALHVAAHVGVPFTTLDLSKNYKESVINYLIDEYKAGRTPNPDVLCNRDIKFGAFLDWAIGRGADKVATGHYAQIKEVGGIYRLLRGADPKKDQSYFLYTLTQKELSRIIFPIGSVAKKAETRKKARAFKLPVAKKPDSQGLCFIGHVDMEEFLSANINVSKGDVLNIEGEVIGRHQGSIIYTLGQRHGFDITRKINEPLYVLAKDIEKNTITVGPKKLQKKLAPHSIRINNMTWTHVFPVGDITAQYRYHGPEVAVKSISPEGVVEFEDTLPEIPAEGQSLVFYRGEECLGGGTVVY